MLTLEDKEWIRFYLNAAQELFQEWGYSEYRSIKASISIRKLLNLTENCEKMDLSDYNLMKRLMLGVHEIGKEMGMDEVKQIASVWNCAIDAGNS